MSDNKMLTIKKRNIIPALFVLHVMVIVPGLLFSYYTTSLNIEQMNIREFAATLVICLLPFNFIFFATREIINRSDNLSIDEQHISFGPQRKRQTIQYKMIDKVTLTENDKVMVFSTDSKNIYFNTRNYAWETSEVTKPIIANLKNHDIKVEKLKEQSIFS